MELIKGFRLPEGSTIFFPDDSVRKQVEKVFGMSIPELKEHPNYKKLILNFVTDDESVYRGNNSNFVTNQGTRFFVDFDSGLVLSKDNGIRIKIVETYVKNNIRFVTLRGMLLTKENMEQFKHVEKVVERFKVGDVVYGRKGGYKNYRIVFGKVTKITPTGKYRISLYDRVNGKSETVGSVNDRDTQTEAIMIKTLTGDSILTDGNGYNTAQRVQFEKYNGEKLYDFYNFRD